MNQDDNKFLDEQAEPTQEEPERGKHEGTHEANMVPPALTLVRDQEWDGTHLTWEGPDGTRYRVHHDDWRFVCPKIADVPPQPAAGWIAVFENGWQWLRAGDGLWYKCNAFEGAIGLEWDELWGKYGTAHYRVMVPMNPGSYPFMMPLEGPVGSIVLPELDEYHNPDLGAGHVAVIDEEERLVIRHLQSNSEVKLNPAVAFNVFAMFIRTNYNERIANQAGPKSQDVGTEIIIIPED